MYAYTCLLDASLALVWQWRRVANDVATATEGWSRVVWSWQRRQVAKVLRQRYTVHAWDKNCMQLQMYGYDRQKVACNINSKMLSGPIMGVESKGSYHPLLLPPSLSSPLSLPLSLSLSVSRFAGGSGSADLRGCSCQLFLSLHLLSKVSLQLK